MLLRRSGRLSQRELAAAAAISERALRDIERGCTRRPHRDTLHAIARALATDPTTTDLLTVAAGRLCGAGAGDNAAGSAGSGGRRGGAEAPGTDRSIGRDRDLAGLVRLLREPAVRLLTITGPAGVGKTHLAREVAAAAPVPHLLVLDDTGPGSIAAAGIRRWLAAGEAHRVLCAAREPLRIPGERRWPLAPLPLPPVDASEPAVLVGNPTVALLLRRAGATRPGFAVTAANASAVTALCRHTGGLPLAVELVAARLRTRQPADLHLELDLRLRRFAGTVVDPLPAIVGWSVALLDARHRHALHALATGTGNEPDPAGTAVFTLAAAGLATVTEHDGRLRLSVPQPVRAVVTAGSGIGMGRDTGMGGGGRPKPAEVTQHLSSQHVNDCQSPQSTTTR